MYCVVADEYHIAQQHLHVEQYLLLAGLIVVVALLFNVDHIAIGDQTILKVGETAGRAEGGVEYHGEGGVLIQLHALVEELAGIEVANNHREVKIIREDASEGVTLLVAIPIAVVVIVLECEALRLYYASAYLCQIVGEEDGFQKFRAIANHNLRTIKDDTIDVDLLGHEAHFQYAALVAVDMILLLKGEALGLFEKNLLAVGFRLIGQRGQLDEKTARKGRLIDEPVVELHVLLTGGDDGHLDAVTILVGVGPVFIMKAEGVTLEVGQQILLRVSVGLVVTNL